MRNRLITAAGTLVALAIIFSGSLQSHFGPSYEDKPIGQWLEQLKADSSEKRDQASRAIATFKEKAVPGLAKALRSYDSRFKQFLYRTSRHVPFLRLRPANQARLRAQAALTLGMIGPKAADAIPELIAALADKEAFVRESAEDALVLVGESAVPMLARSLTAEAPLRRRHATRALGRLAQCARAASPALIQVLNDSDSETRALSAEALGKIRDHAAIPALAVSLRDPSARVRESAATSLSQFGPDAAPATADLVTALADGHEGVRISAANALGKIGKPASVGVPELIANLRHNAALVRASAALALGRIGSRAIAATPALIVVLKDNDAFARIQAAQALGRIGPMASDAVTSLISALVDEPIALRICAAEALGAIGPAAKPAVPVLITALNSDHSGMRKAVVPALGRISPELAGQFPVEAE